MEEITQLIVNNGLGVASFIALIFFMNNYLVKINTVIEKISETLVSVEKSLSDLSARVDKIERKANKKKEEVE